VADWGTRRPGERGQADSFGPRRSAVGTEFPANRGAAIGVRESYQYLVGDSAWYFAVDDGAIELHDGLSADPAVTLTTDEETWAGLSSGVIEVSSAVASGALKISGDRKAMKRMGRIFNT